MTVIVALLTYNILLFLTLALPAGKMINNNINSLKNETSGFSWNIRLFWVIVAIIIVAGTREYYVGVDYSGYLEFYSYILNHGKFPSPWQDFEAGWKYLNFIFAKVGVPAGLFFGLVAGLIWFFFIKASYRFQFLLPLMFFFVITNGIFFWTLSGLRQSLAVVIFFYAIRFIIEKKPLQYAIYILVASLFHVSALIMLPVYFLRIVKFNRNLFFVLYILSIAFIGSDWFLTQITSLISLIGSRIDVFSRYIQYLETAKFAFNEERISSGLGVLLRIATTLFILYKSKTVLDKQPKLALYFVLFFLGDILTNIFFAVEIIGRITVYFNICFSIVVASSVYYSIKKYEKITAILLILAYFLMFNTYVYRMFIDQGVI
jgi:hypothetical protein